MLCVDHLLRGLADSYPSRDKRVHRKAKPQDFQLDRDTIL